MSGVLTRLQELLRHLQQLHLDLVGFEWDDDVEIVAAAHVYVFDATRPGEGAVSHPSPSQRVPWSPLALELPLEHGTTYLYVALPPHATTCRTCCCFS